MGTHFDPNCKHFPDSHFIEFPFYREKIATLYTFFRSPFPEKQMFWSRNPCCLTSFFSKSSHFRESLAICRQNPHFIENPFYREKIAAHFGGISRKIPILSNSHFIENVLYVRPVFCSGSRDLGEFSSDFGRKDSSFIYPYNNLVTIGGERSASPKSGHSGGE